MAVTGVERRRSSTNSTFANPSPPPTLLTLLTPNILLTPLSPRSEQAHIPAMSSTSSNSTLAVAGALAGKAPRHQTLSCSPHRRAPCTTCTSTSIPTYGILQTPPLPPSPPHTTLPCTLTLSDRHHLLLHRFYSRPVASPPPPPLPLRPFSLFPSSTSLLFIFIASYLPRHRRPRPVVPSPQGRRAGARGSGVLAHPRPRCAAPYDVLLRRRHHVQREDVRGREEKSREETRSEEK